VTIYSNTTPLLAFSAIGRLDLMNRVHGEICIVPSVVAECGAGGVVEVPDLTKLPWIRIEREPAQDESRFFMLDAGERDTLSAALRGGADLVLIDERLGRNLAEFYGLRVAGTLGTLKKAKELGFIPEFLPLVRELQGAGFWYHEDLVRRLAADVGESPF
jgi:predicted nucleic acid-binding protein